MRDRDRRGELPRFKAAILDATGAICGNSRMKLIAHILMLGMAAALSSHAFGQTAEQPRPAERDKSLAVAPQAAPAADPRPSENEARDTAAGPANICRELVTFLEPKPAQPPAAAGQPGPNPAASAAGPSVQGSGQPAPVPQAPAAAAPPVGAYDEATRSPRPTILKVAKKRRSSCGAPVLPCRPA